MPQAIISPSVLAGDFGQLAVECRRMMSGGAQWLHMDVMDGHFVPNITIGAPVLCCVHQAIPDIFMDCHMMVSNPEQWVSAIADAGGSLYCFHIEATKNPLALIAQIREQGMKAGVAISPDTPSSAITDAIGEAADMLLVMTVHPGRGGQKFMESCVPKVAELRARFPEKDIEVDGGVSPRTIGQCADAGSNVIVAGTAIFKADSPEKVIASLKDTVNAAQARAAAAIASGAVAVPAANGNGNGHAHVHDHAPNGKTNGTNGAAVVSADDCLRDGPLGKDVPANGVNGLNGSGNGAIHV